MRSAAAVKVAEVLTSLAANVSLAANASIAVANTAVVSGQQHHGDPRIGIVGVNEERREKEEELTSRMDEQDLDQRLVEDVENAASKGFAAVETESGPGELTRPAGNQVEVQGGQPRINAGPESDDVCERAVQAAGFRDRKNSMERQAGREKGGPARVLNESYRHRTPPRDRPNNNNNTLAYEMELTVSLELVGGDNVSSLELMKDIRMTCGALVGCRPTGPRKF